MATTQEILNNQEKYFAKELEKIIDNLHKEVNRIVAKLDFDDFGNILSNDRNFKKIATLQAQITKAFKQSGYEKLTGKVLKDNKAIYNSRAKATGFKLGEVDKNTLKALTELNYNYMQELNADGLSAVLKSLTANVTTGANFKELIQNIENSLEGRLKPYAETYMNTAKREFVQKSENLIAEEIDFGQDKNDIWEYIGSPLVEKSHLECIWALTQKPHFPLFTNEEKILFDAGLGSPQYKNRSAIRWNCRHWFAITNITHEEYLKT